MLRARVEIVAGSHAGRQIYAEVSVDGTNATPADRQDPPQAFHKSAHSVIGPGEEILLPPEARIFAEAEIAIVFGRPARNLTAATALQAVFGYTCANDVTNVTAPERELLGIEAKSADTFTPLGPFIRTDLRPDDISVALGDDESMTAWVSTAELGRGVVELLVYLTAVLTLHPGDVVLTGALCGNRLLRPGSISRVIAPAIGELRNPVSTFQPRVVEEKPARG